MSAPVVQISLEGQRELVRALRRMDPTKRAGLMRGWLLESAFAVQRRAQEKEIRRGGNRPPLPNKLTSRTGTGRRSIVVERSELPRAISVGTNLRYMGLHERGGTITRLSSLGNPHRATYPARPFLAPALRNSRGKIRELFIRRWTQAIRTA